MEIKHFGRSVLIVKWVPTGRFEAIILDKDGNEVKDSSVQSYIPKSAVDACIEKYTQHLIDSNEMPWMSIEEMKKI